MVPNTQTSYKVTQGELCVAGILRASNCTAEEHEHFDAQLTFMFQGNAPSLVTRSRAPAKSPCW